MTAILQDTQAATERRKPLHAIASNLPWLRIGLWAIVGMCFAIIAFSYAVPLWFRMNGDRLLIVTSGSMSSTMEPGDALAITPLDDPSNLQVGQIVTFWSTEANSLVTHRIAAIDTQFRARRLDDGTTRIVTDANGEAIRDAWLTTKGDANSTVDGDKIPPSIVQGIVSHIYSGWGKPLTFAESPRGRLLLFGLPLLLLVSAELLSRMPAGRWRRFAGDRRTRQSEGPLPKGALPKGALPKGGKS